MTELKDFLETSDYLNSPTKSELFQQTMMIILENTDPNNHKLSQAVLDMSKMINEMCDTAAREMKQLPEMQY